MARTSDVHLNPSEAHEILKNHLFWRTGSAASSASAVAETLRFQKLSSQRSACQMPQNTVAYDLAFSDVATCSFQLLICDILEAAATDIGKDIAFATPPSSVEPLLHPSLVLRTLENGLRVLLPKVR